MNARLTFGIYPFPQTAPFEPLADRARRAEQAGFDTLWVADETPMAYPGAIALEAWSLLGALARETSRVRLGTLVSPVVLRHPLLLAMCAATVDHVSNGRVILGLGAGGVAEDLAGVGLDGLSARDLVERLDEQVTMIDALLRGETVTRGEGPHRTREAVVEQPVQRPRPPLWVAGQGRRSIEVAVGHADGWNSLGGQPITGDRLSFEAAIAATRRQVEMVDEACMRHGRDPATIVRSVFAFRYDEWASVDAFSEFVGRYRELGFSDFVVGWPSTGTQAVFDRVVSDVIPAVRAG